MHGWRGDSRDKQIICTNLQKSVDTDEIFIYTTLVQFEYVVPWSSG